MKRLHATMKDYPIRSAGIVHGPVSLNATAAIEDCTPPNVSSRRIEATAKGGASVYSRKTTSIDNRYRGNRLSRRGRRAARYEEAGHTACPCRVEATWTARWDRRRIPALQRSSARSFLASG